MNAWLLLSIASVALTLLGATSVVYAGAGRGTLRGHDGELPAFAGTIHVVGLFAVGPTSYEFFALHLSIVLAVLVLAVSTIDRRQGENPRLVATARAAYVLAYSISVALVSAAVLST